MNANQKKIRSYLRLFTVIIVVFFVQDLIAQNTSSNENIEGYLFQEGSVTVGECGHCTQQILARQAKYIDFKQNGETLQNGTKAPNSFPQLAVEECGKFKLYYYDYETNYGFYDPDFGEERRSTFCAVLNYIESVIEINSGQGSIEIEVLSSTFHPNRLGWAGSHYNSNFLNTAGIYNGFTFDHITEGIDPDDFYDCQVTINFGATDMGEISYYNDYLSTPLTESYDLFTLLLHEMTHALGFSSQITDTEDDFNITCANSANSFSNYDWHFGYYGDISDPSSFIDNKLVVGTIDAPIVNTNLNSFEAPLRTYNVWIHDEGAPNNHAMSGRAPNDDDDEPPSLSHWGFDRYFNNASHFSPGFQPKHVMAPNLYPQELKRVWSNAEIRALVELGYSINPSYSEIDIILNNQPAYRNDYGSNSLMSGYETVQEDYLVINIPGATITHFVNNSTISDNEGDLISIMENSLFGLRGVTTGGNNHNLLEINDLGTEVVYTPEPGFIGRAQFGYYLWDGKEQGALEIITIEVYPDPNYNVPVGDELVINGNYEDATEIWTHYDLDKTYVSSNFFLRMNYLNGVILAGGHPFSHSSNTVYPGGSGIITYQSLDHIQGGPGDAVLGFKSSPFLNSPFPTFFPNPDSNIPNNIRFTSIRSILFESNKAFSTLKNDFIAETNEQEWHYYNFSCALSFDQSQFDTGETLDLTLKIINEPSNNPVIYQEINHSFIINDVSNNSFPYILGTEVWQTIEFSFYYCGEVDCKYISLERNSNFTGLKTTALDNISIKEQEVSVIYDYAVTQQSLGCDASISIWGDNPIEVLWSGPGVEGETDLNINSLTNGTYTATMTFEGGCSVVEVFEITGFEPIVVSLISFENEFCNNSEGSILVSATGGNGNLEYQWDDSLSTSGSFIDNLVAGIYTVTVIDNGCAAPIELEVTIDNVDLALDFTTIETASNNSDYNNQTLYFGSDLVIPFGVNLTISNSNLHFNQNHGITVEEGGLLILDNTEVQNNECSDYWQGIEVFGIPTQYQGPNPYQGYGHGRVRLLNGTIIRNAQIGVVNGDRTEYGYWNPSHSGGKIIAEGASFINCREAVRIQKYASTGPLSIHCQFYNTNFTWDDDFSFNYFGPMIKMYYAKKVEIHGCNFTNVNEDLFAMPNLGYYHTAIYMIKSSINMDDDDNNSRMEGFNYGIVNFSKTASSIRNTDFNNYRSIWFYKNKTSRITENTFGNMSQNLEDLTGTVNIYDPTWQAHYGIYMEYSSGFWLEDNVLNFPLNNVDEGGIFVRASGETYNQLYDNDFQNCFYGVIAFDDNRSDADPIPGLNLLCNNFNNNHTDLLINYIDEAQNGWGISSKQGSGAVSAGNQFGTVLDQGLKIDNYLDHIDYFRVSSENIEDDLLIDGEITILDSDFPNLCVSNVNKSKEEKKTDALVYKNEAISFRSQLDNLVDGGDTDALTDEVLYADYTEALELYYELMSKSPNLSLKVMEEAVDKEYTLPPALLTLILQSNPTAAKSSKLQSKLDDRLIPLNEYQRYMIDQGKNLISEKEYLEAKLAYNELNFISLMNQAINLIVFDENITDKEAEIDFLLSGYEEVEHHYMKIDRALENQNYNLAQSILDNIPTNFNLRTRQDQEWMDYQICYQLLIELEQNNNNSLTDIQIDNLMVIAEKHSNSAAGLAWQMLGQYDAAYVLEGMIVPGSHTKSLARNGKKEEINPFDELQYIRVFPNPVDKITILEFVGYETQLSITLMDSNGKLILSKIVAGYKLQEVLNLGEYANGLYNLTVNDKSGILLNEQIIIKH